MVVASAKRASLGVLSDDNEGANETADEVRGLSGLSVAVADLLSLADIIRSIRRADVR